MIDYRKRKLVKRFLELDNLRKTMEKQGCLKRSCSSCLLLVRVNEHWSTCPFEKFGDEMLEIYKKLFPDDNICETSWSDKVKKVKKMALFNDGSADTLFVITTIYMAVFIVLVAILRWA